MKNATLIKSAIGLMMLTACQTLPTAGRAPGSAVYRSGGRFGRETAGQHVRLTEEALRIHRSAIVIDGHNDLPWRLREKAETSEEVVDLTEPQPDLHTDIPRLRLGGLGAQFWAAWVPPDTSDAGGDATLPLRTAADVEGSAEGQRFLRCRPTAGGATRIALEQIDLIRRMVERYPDVFEMAYSADDIVRIRRQGKIASLIGVEGGHTIGNSLGVLRMFHELGVRYMTLTHAESTDWADSATDEARHGGLTAFGEEVVQEMNRLGMLVDISHVSVQTVDDVLRVSRAPVIASHSSAHAVAAHPRNIPDDLLRSISENGGVVMVNFFSGFVDPEGASKLENVFQVMRDLRRQHPDDEEFRKAKSRWRRRNPIPRGTVHTVVDHIDHIVQVAGIDHVGLGSDYDGVSRLPEQLDDVSCFPYITQELLNRGYESEDIHKILGGNILRVLRRAEQVARDSG